MTDTFDGTTIQVEAVGPPREQGADISIRHIPGGAAAYVDLGGLTPRTLSYTLFFSTAADYSAFESKVGVQGTLSTTADGTTTAVLLSLKRSERSLGTNGETTATAEFVLT